MCVFVAISCVHCLKASIKRCVVSFFLKIASVDEFLVFGRRRFHSVEAAMENDLSPSVLYDLMIGCSRDVNVPDLSERCGSCFTFTSSWMYEGAIEL